MSVLDIELTRPSALARIVSSLRFRPWQRRRRVDIRQLSRHLRRDIGIDL